MFLCKDKTVLNHTVSSDPVCCEYHVLAPVQSTMSQPQWKFCDTVALCGYWLKYTAEFFPFFVICTVEIQLHEVCYVQRYLIIVKPWCMLLFIHVLDSHLLFQQINQEFYFILFFVCLLLETLWVVIEWLGCKLDSLRVWMPVGAGDTAFLQNVQTGSGGHPASYSVVLGFFPRCKVARVWSLPVASN